MKTTNVKDRLSHLYGLDVSKIPDEIDDKNTMVTVSCFLHGEYTAKYETLRTSSSSASPGCPICKSYPHASKQLRTARKLKERGYHCPDYSDPVKRDSNTVASPRFQGKCIPTPSKMGEDGIPDRHNTVQ